MNRFVLCAVRLNWCHVIFKWWQLFWEDVRAQMDAREYFFREYKIGCFFEAEVVCAKWNGVGKMPGIGSLFNLRNTFPVVLTTRENPKSNLTTNISVTSTLRLSRNFVSPSKFQQRMMNYDQACWELLVHFIVRRQNHHTCWHRQVGLNTGRNECRIVEM